MLNKIKRIIELYLIKLFFTQKDKENLACQVRAGQGGNEYESKFKSLDLPGFGFLDMCCVCTTRSDIQALANFINNNIYIEFIFISFKFRIFHL